MNAFAIPTLSRRVAGLRARVRSATPRERLMLAALTVMAVLILLSVGIRLFRNAKANYDAVRVLELKAAMLAQTDPMVKTMLAEKARKLGGKRLSATEFSAAIDTLARESGLNPEMPTPKTDKDKAVGLTIHRVKLTLRAPSLQKLMEFDDRLRLNDRGLVVERVTVESRSESGELSAVYEIVACQLSA